MAARLGRKTSWMEYWESGCVRIRHHRMTAREDGAGHVQGKESTQVRRGRVSPWNRLFESP